MANAFLQGKWKVWYKSMDVNHDGKISKEDVEESRSKFTQLHQELEPDQKKRVEENFEKWWNDFIFRGKTGDISVEDFVASLNKDFQANKEQFVKDITACFTTMFDVIDTNHDKDISKDEFIKAFQAYGHENVGLDTNFFESYGPKDGLVPMKDIVASWIDFVTSEDESKDSIVQKGFATGV